MKSNDFKYCLFKTLLKRGEIVVNSKRFFCLFLSILLLACAFSFNVFAEEIDAPADEIIETEYVNISKTSAEFSINGIDSKSAATLRASKSMSLKIVMELQKKKSSGYETIKTWTSSKTGTSFSMSESRAINALSTYRLKVTFTAGNETNVVYRYDS